MADVFISYKSERRPAARHLADIIEAHGFSVWFDYALVPGKNFGRHIEAELRAAKAAVVLWCPLSVGSEWVHNEAALAKRLGTFVPARIGACDPPLEFLRDDFVDLLDWDGDPSTRRLDRLIDRLEHLVGREATIQRRRLIDLHTAWMTYGRPTLESFQLAPKLEVEDSERQMPSDAEPGRTGDSPAPLPPPAPPTAAPAHDYAFWERQWEKQRSGENLVAMRAIAEDAPRYFADQARERIAEVEAEQERVAREQAVERQAAQAKAAAEEQERSARDRAEQQRIARKKAAAEAERLRLASRARPKFPNFFGSRETVYELRVKSSPSVDVGRSTSERYVEWVILASWHGKTETFTVLVRYPKKTSSTSNITASIEQSSRSVKAPTPQDAIISYLVQVYANDRTGWHLEMANADNQPILMHLSE